MQRASPRVPATHVPPATPQEAKLDGEYEVRTPVAGFNGERAGVLIKNGVGVTFSLKDALECHRLGYTVKDLKTGQLFLSTGSSDAK